LEGMGLGEAAAEEALAPAVEVVPDHGRDPLVERLRYRLRILPAQQNQVGHAIRMLDHIPEGEQTRTGIRDEGEGRTHRLLEDGEEILVSAVDVVASARSVGPAVAALVHGRDTEVAGEVRELVLPLPAVGGGLALGEKEEIPAAAPGHLVEEPDTASRYVHRITSSSRRGAVRLVGWFRLAWRSWPRRTAGLLVEDESRAASHRLALVPGDQVDAGGFPRRGQGILADAGENLAFP